MCSVTDAPQIDPVAVKGRATQLLRVVWPQWEPHLREFIMYLDSPMVRMGIQTVFLMLPRPVNLPKDGLQELLSYLRGCKDLPSEELRDRVGEFIDALPDQALTRWGGVLAWVLTGSS